ncbi:hypothetical protein EVG20_g10101, partial [Dentipellis fragilis]
AGMDAGAGVDAATPVALHRVPELKIEAEAEVQAEADAEGPDDASVRGLYPLTPSSLHHADDEDELDSEMPVPASSPAPVPAPAPRPNSAPLHIYAHPHPHPHLHGRPRPVLPPLQTDFTQTTARPRTRPRKPVAEAGAGAGFEYITHRLATVMRDEQLGKLKVRTWLAHELPGAYEPVPEEQFLYRPPEHVLDGARVFAGMVDVGVQCDGGDGVDEPAGGKRVVLKKVPLRVQVAGAGEPGVEDEYEEEETHIPAEKFVEGREWCVRGLVAQGVLSTVHVAQHRTGVLHALRSTHFGVPMACGAAERLMRELKVMRALQRSTSASPYLLGPPREVDDGWYWATYGWDLCVVTPYCPGGDLEAYCGNVTDEQAGWVAAEMVFAIEHLHKLKIIHNDIRPANILIDAQGHCKLGDFKSVTIMGDRDCEQACQGPVNVTYRAPECGKERQDADYGSPEGDWRSLGVTLMELVSQKDRGITFEFIPPNHCEQDESERFSAYIAERLSASPAHSQHLIQLITDLLQHNPVNAASSPETKIKSKTKTQTKPKFKEHPFFSELTELPHPPKPNHIDNLWDSIARGEHPRKRSFSSPIAPPLTQSRICTAFKDVAPAVAIVHPRHQYEMPKTTPPASKSEADSCTLMSLFAREKMAITFHERYDPAPL